MYQYTIFWRGFGFAVLLGYTMLSEVDGRLGMGKTGYDIALERIEEAKRTGATELDLRSLRIENLPEKLFFLSNLSSLDISFNKLTFLSEKIELLSNVTSLKIHGNILDSLPKNINKLKNLSYLDIGFNKLTSIPFNINQLSKLSYLDIGLNNLLLIPDCIGELSKLHTLNICNNELHDLPESIVKLSNLKYLDIHKNKLSSLPKKIFELFNLTYLDISQNNLISLPEEFNKLINLSKLSLRENKFISLPSTITQLKNLYELDISFNKLTSLPDDIGNLSNLKYLYIRGNYLTLLPDSIGNLSNLPNFSIDFNKLTSLPDSIGNLSNISTLSIRGNNIIFLPDTICQLTNLSSLNLSNNQLTSIPDNIHNLSNLTHLDIGGNNLISIPETIGQLKKLSYLNVRKNQLKSLPDTISKLSNLRSIIVYDNPLINPPIEVVKQGIEAIRNYFEEKTKGFDKVFEAKLLIVGEPGAGKTSLQRKLLNIHSLLPEKEESTKGIDIVDWNYTYKNQRIKIHIWDFGGQQILKATHSFFMNHGAVFVLLADSRSDNTDYFDWLYRIETFAGHSPVILVHNELDDRPKEININQLSQRFSEFKMPLRCNLAKVKQEDRGDEFNEVVKKIQYEISKLDVMGQELPSSWISIRNELVNLATTGNFFISKVNFISICEHFDVNYENSKFISQYLHAIGAILHFQDDPILNHLVIIQPEWATDAVYKLIENITIQQNYGRFSFDDLNGIWEKECYQDQYHALIQLIKNFQLCYEIPSQQRNYILPQLLPYQPQEYSWDGKGNLLIEYVYPDYYLTDIMTRFIVNSHDLIENHDFVWRNGVVLSKGEQRAEIMSDENRQRIKIRISGDFKYNLLITIMDTFDKIHKDYPKMKIEIKVPCNCNHCKISLEPTFYDLQYLRTRLKNRRFRVECKNPPYYTVDIQDLIEYLGSYEILETYEENNRLVSSK